MAKIPGGESRSSRNVVTRESKPPASATIAKHVYAANDNTKRSARAARGESSQSGQTQQRYIRSLSDMVGLELTCEAQQKPQQVTRVIITK